MFWMRKEKVNENACSQLFIQAISLADGIFDKLTEIDPENKYVSEEKINHWYFFVSIASSITGLFELEDPKFNHYLSNMKIKLEKLDSHGAQAADDFIQFVRNSGGNEQNLSEVTALWLYYNIKGSTDFVSEETKPFMSAGKFVCDIFYNWFEKNGISIN